ncbi:MAG: sn-glycerol-3-phosphate ABC transporter substrate-binding protein UgpB [Proteobacteria bacterium]|nr:sn-glycerol-3-phosphate ABC transporter substrate-binding protein UgpB [Pseudomonadota bacterium]
MMKNLKTTIILTMSVFLLMAFTAQAKTKEVVFWHSHGGGNGELVGKIAKLFNDSQSEYRVKALYKGTYAESMTAAIAAFRARKQPHIVQVFEVGTATMMAAKGAIYPVHQLMKDTGEDWDPNKFIPTVSSYYTTTEGKLLSMPFNSSTPVLFYNKDMFKKGGVEVPKTWNDLVNVSRSLMKSGLAKCGFTTGWQSWVQIENQGAYHNKAMGTKQNGFGGLDTEFIFNKGFHLNHIQNMVEWQKDKVFVYGGRRGDPNGLFVKGECAMLMNSSAYQSSITRGVKFNYGVAFMPYYSNVSGAPQNSIIGGATLWVLTGHKSDEYKGVAKFLNFASSTAVQTAWHQFTGYLPITQEAGVVAEMSGYYKLNPGADVSIHQMNLNPPTPNSKGLRFGNFVQVRDVINEELESIWAGKKSAQEGLNDAVSRGNKMLRKFERANR